MIYYSESSAFKQIQFLFKSLQFLKVDRDKNTPFCTVDRQKSSYQHRISALLYLTVLFVNQVYLTRFEVEISKLKVYPAGIYLFKVNNMNARSVFEVCSNLTLKHQNDVIDVILVSFLITLSILHTFLCCFHV